MRRTLPSMMSLEAFEASARHLSFAEAARECCLTQGAISRQVRLLEAALETELFLRTRGGLLLTTAGQELLRGIRPGLDGIAAAVSRVTLRRGGEQLRLATLPGFGARWMMPRYASFSAQHPDISVAFFTRTDPVSFEDQPFDAAIHFGTSLPAGVPGDWLMSEDPVPVCHPSIRHPAGLSLAEALSSYQLLHHLHRASSWTDWMSAAGVTGLAIRNGPAFEQLHLMIEAAASRLGLALLPRFMVQQELASGVLVAPFEQRVNSGWGYWLTYPGNRPLSHALRAFREWLVPQATGRSL
jgi:LysR family glycine cleavage system transcriptional activator